MKQGSDTRQKLLDAADELIWASNYGSVSVDDICAKADVNKGSFYHFFQSKAELAVEALEDHWQKNRGKLDTAFSPQLSPLDRITAFCDAIYDSQKAKMAKAGKVCGCPYGSIGSEQSTVDDAIRMKSMEIFGRMGKYLTATLREAQADGVIAAGDPDTLSQQIHALLEGILLQAKLQNDLEVIRQLKPAIFRLVGAKSPAVSG